MVVEVGEIVNVYVTKKMSKARKRLGFARFYQVGNIQALENRLNRIKIGEFKLKANIAKFEKMLPSLCKDARRLNGRVFDVPSKPIQVSNINSFPHMNLNETGFKGKWLAKLL